GINIQNPRKEPLFRNERGLMETDAKKIDAAIHAHSETGNWPSWVSGVVDERAVYVARPGKKLIICDLAQIEPRVLDWCAGNHASLARIAGGMCMYESFARDV